MKPRVCAAACLLACGAATAQDVCATLQNAAATDWVNSARAKGASCGSRGAQPAAPPLVWNEVLHTAAQRQAQWLAKNGALAHTGPHGETLRERAAAAGYVYVRIAENVAQGQRSVPQVLAGWTASESHCLNLFDSTVTEMALACAPGRDGRPYWALLLGRPQP